MRCKQKSLIDRLLGHADQALRTLVPGAATAQRPSPAAEQPVCTLPSADSRHIAGLMRINHTGEVCAQALYLGQALTARRADIQAAMQQAADEEIDHLVWCEERLTQLGGRTSMLNPLFYGASFALGAVAGCVGDAWSLGFVAATEDQVCRHLAKHLAQIPHRDKKTKAVLEQMLTEEKAHATHALQAGGRVFSVHIKQLMTGVSVLMTATTYYI